MKIIIIGCGRIGAGLAQYMSQQGNEVVVLDNKEEAFNQLDRSFKGKKIVGVGFDKDLLQQAGIEKADALAATTSSDDSNAIIARIAKETFRVPKVIARMHDKKKSEIYQQLGVQTISSTTMGIKKAVDLLSYNPLDSVHSIADGSADIVEVRLPIMLVGYQVSELCVPYEYRVISITRGKDIIIPELSNTLEADDYLLIVVNSKSKARLKRRLGIGE